MNYRYISINELNIDEISDKVSKERIERSAKFKSEDDKKRSICVEYLLNEMVKEYSINTPVVLNYDEKGKPHILDEYGKDLIQFSLSHSGDYVACIVSDNLCGIDIERHSRKRKYESIAKRICTESELKLIKNEQEFYNIWTLKESVLKAVGLGFALDMRKFELTPLEGKEGFYCTVVDDITYVGEVIQGPEGYSLSYVELE